MDSRLTKVVGWFGCGLLAAFLAVPAAAQGARAKAELKAASGAITIDYGAPSLAGRDMLSKLEEGSFWRMGMNQATVLTTPAALDFAGTKVEKGSYSLWLKKEASKFVLVFNSRLGSGERNTIRPRTSAACRWPQRLCRALSRRSPSS